MVEICTKEYEIVIYPYVGVRKSPRKKLGELIKDKNEPEQQEETTRSEKPAPSTAVSSSSAATSKPKKAKKAKKKKIVLSSSEESDSDFDTEPEAFLDMRFEDLGTQDRSKIRNFRNFYIRIMLLKSEYREVKMLIFEI